MSSTALTVVPDIEPDADSTTSTATGNQAADEHTDSQPAPTDTGDEATDDRAPVPPNATAAYMDPRELVIAENVRKDFDVDQHPKQAASIREFGVTAPVLAEREPDGSVHVIDGQVRVLIAQAVGVTQVPVWITQAPTEIDIKQRRIDRTMAQINLNERRIPLTQADYAAGVALMMDLGASPTRIARGLQKAKRAEVRKLAAVGRSQAGRTLIDDGQYSLDQLAVIAEYDNLGDTDAVEKLTSASRYTFGYTANAIAADRDETRRRLHASLPYAAYGFGILTDEPGADDGYLAVTDLTRADGEPLTDDDVYAEPARWLVWVEVEENGELVDTATGALVDPDTVDWDTQHDPDAEPGDGLRRADGLAWRDRWIPAYYLLADQLDTAGLRLAVPDAADPAAALAAAEQAAAAREESRLARRRVRELNKRGVAAAGRRQDFLSTYLQRTKPPAQAAHFVAEYLARNLAPGALQLVTKLLGIGSSTEELVKVIGSAPVNRTWVLALGMVLATHEATLDKSLWRTRSQATTRYLHLLADIAGPDDDFALVEVEQAAAGDIDYRDIPIDK
ncbi:ParB/RepB/Spo0J family partition protein [Nocardia africana]|uniref:ParB-like nuclease domain n=1 Tax=Nocardia africana TaxID=134964 RepID=A0A378X3T6_9NOCA|nr:ParB/RepB/Spo0J family partition protein [Nocardia africana]SUA47311.1 ParB-like nuclease domain [Nocardia africana]